MRNYFDPSVLTISFFGKVILITVIAWVPIFIIKKIISCIDPSDYEKIMASRHKPWLRLRRSSSEEEMTQSSLSA